MNRWVKGCGIGCGVLLLLGVLAGVGVFSWFARTFGSKPGRPPAVRPATALRPHIILRKGEPYAAGTAVAVRAGRARKPMVITALHLFGTSGGLKEEVPPAKMNEVVREIWLAPVGGRGVVAKARGALLKTGSPVDQNGKGSGDVAAFALLPGATVPHLELASRDPALGEWLWLVGDTYDHEPEQQRVFPAQAIPIMGSLTVKFTSRRLQMQGMSGAPLLNARGEVAGLLLGGEGASGVAISAAQIRKELQKNGL